MTSFRMATFLTGAVAWLWRTSRELAQDDERQSRAGQTRAGESASLSRWLRWAASRLGLPSKHFIVVHCRILQAGQSLLDLGRLDPAVGKAQGTLPRPTLLRSTPGTDVCLPTRKCPKAFVTAGKASVPGVLFFGVLPDETDCGRTSIDQRPDAGLKVVCRHFYLQGVEGAGCCDLCRISTRGDSRGSFFTMVLVGASLIE